FKAAQLKQCKICPSSFPTLQRLKKHVLNHKPNTKRRKALEAIDSLIQDKSTPSTTCSKSKEDVAPTSLFTKFKKVFPELFSDAVDLNKNNLPNTTKSVPENRETSSSLPESTETPAKSANNDITISNSPPEEITACINELLDSITHINAKSCNVLPATSSLLELQEDLLLNTSSSSEDSVINASTPIPNIPNSQPHLSYKFNSNNSLVQEQLSSPIIIQANILNPASVKNITSSSSCLKKEKEKDISILDLILTNSQESLDGELNNNLSPPPKPVSSPANNNSGHKNNSRTKFLSAAKEGLCMICSKTIILEDLLQHLYQHKPCPLRAKCLEGFRSCFPPNKIPTKKSSSSNKPQEITPIEVTFREKFPELPIFKKQNSLNNSSSDESVLLEKMDSPPTGPPPISPFKKALYSRVVKKGLFYCQFCEKAYVSETRAIQHKKEVHGISPHKTVTSIFPDCPPEMCRVCCKGPAPYSTIADHYKFVHNLAISTTSSTGTISSIVIPSNNFVSTTKKHARNFITKLPPSENPKSNQYSQSTLKNPPASNSIKSQVYSNLKIVARPELRGAGPSKIVSFPTTAICKKSSPSPIVHPQISVQAEVHHRNNSQIPQNNSPRKCTLCPFIAIKQIGLRLHYFKNHGLRKIPSGITNPQNILQQNHDKQTNSPLPGTITQVNYAIPAPSKIVHHKTRINQTKNCSSIKKPSLISPEIATQIYTANPTPPGAQVSNEPPNPMISSLPIVPFVSMQNSILQYSFPLQTRTSCQTRHYSLQLDTEVWFTTNSSIKKHLNVFHNQKPSKVKYHCSICNSTIAKNPAKHSCLVDNLILPPPAIDGDHWVCHICECFSANTQLAKKNHLDAHNRETIKNNSSHLIIPTASKLKKKLKSKRIQELSEGPPGNLPLAPPLSEVNHNNLPISEEIEHIQKIDVEHNSILSSFAEPLDALFELDDMENAQLIFENLLKDLTSVIENHFHLSPSPNNNNKPSATTSKNNRTDSQNAQLIQKQYRWNRKKCVRNIVNPSTSFCPINKECIKAHFSNIWAPPPHTYQFQSCSPPSLPQVIDIITPESAAACLRRCENSAPGPDKISYQHWKTIDPNCTIISKIFHICLKLNNIPSPWKDSNCILIPKKGDLSTIENWRPITLSNSIYKLFTKCLAYKLQDWCGTYEVLSPCQKGFTPFDGVVEHNFVIGNTLKQQEDPTLKLSLCG
ncbi:retrovirus-related Pol polyprotein from type-1 retrotransposable element R2, partial [Nephila pilipes]